MRRTIRCEHMFAPGLCREKGCPHRERRGSGLRSNNIRPKVCNKCGGPGVIKYWKKAWLCKGCADLTQERGPRGPLWLLTMLALGCGGVDVPKIPTPGTCGLWEELRVLEANPGTCLWAASNNSDMVFVPLEECPGQNEPTCVIIFPDEPVQVWGELSRPPSAATSEAFDLLDDGGCPVSCDAEYGCAPVDEEPTLCVPCTAAEPC